MEPIISKNCRIRYPDHFSVGRYSVVDDYCYFSTKIQIGMYTHIASGCSISGGVDRSFTIGDFCSISSGVRIWCTSNDFVNDLVVLNIDQLENDVSPIEGDINIGDMCGIGSNTVIMPNNDIPVGVSIGALSFVPPGYEFEPWSVYWGTPIELKKRRNKDRVMTQRKFIESGIRNK